MKQARDLLKLFTKDEVISIAEEMEIDHDPAGRSVKILESILKSVEDEGVPEPDDCSDLLFEFLVNSDIIDEDGNILDDVQEEIVVEEEEDEEPEQEIKLPECYTYADEKDPSCRKCSVFDQCMTERISNRPACYGKRFEQTAAECQMCIEAINCMLATEKNRRQIQKLLR